jgi:hypothetical protein
MSSLRLDEREPEEPERELLLVLLLPPYWL